MKAPIELWVAPLPDPLTAAQSSAYAEVLTEAERASLSRFREPRRRDQALVARSMVRRALSRRLGGRPEAWRFKSEANGRPWLVGADGIDFNLAHADGCVVLAISEAGRVGVDVEPFARAGEIASLADRVLAPAEIVALQQLGPAEQNRRLVHLWTLKESWAKAIGDGLAVDFRTLALIADGNSFRLLNAPEVRFATYDVAPAHAVALAHARNVRAVKRFRVSELFPNVATPDSGPLTPA